MSLNIIWITVFNATFNNISAISWRWDFIGGGNRITSVKSQNFHRLLTNLIA